MALRINDAVIRGWIDNTTPGETRGGIELVGIERPLHLILRGNCWRDIAGTRLDFVNPRPKLQESLLGKIHGLQRGVVGDMTASRKVKVPLISSQEFESYLEAKKEIPFAWQNSIHLEWFSLMNGRVVIDATGFNLTLSAHHWEVDEKEDLKQRMENEQSMKHFMQIISQANQAESEIDDKCIGEADEYEWEKRLRVKDSLEEALLFLGNDHKSDEELNKLQENKTLGRFGLVQRSFTLKNEVMLYLKDSYLDDGPRGELAMTVAYIHNVINEAWPEQDKGLETGFRIAVLKRAIDASIAAISACNTLEMEDDIFGEFRNDVFIIRDELISLKRHLREQQDQPTDEAEGGNSSKED